ncbi:hypothetical protein ACJIZ3_015293 [Penstemon smallii]|uniref:Uncharacterized protein n=1 Tax=Penstemon smallii TaxID=265156 RepID=A0ABD3RM33_9LAMI
MALLSFWGRLLFVSFFVLSAMHEYKEFGPDGGPGVKSLGPKFSVFSKHFTTQTGFQLPNVGIWRLVLATISMRLHGSLFFLMDCYLGAILLLLHQAFTAPILYDFYNYDADTKEFAQLLVKFTQNLALLGALLFFIGMKNSMPRRSPKKKVSKTRTKPN